MPYAEIDEEDGSQVCVTTSYADRFLIKQLPGSRWDSVRKIWTAPLAWSTCVILRGLFEADLVIGDELKVWAIRERTTRVDEATRLRDLLELEDSDDSPAAKVIRSWRGTGERTLRPFQEAGVRYLYAAVCAGLTDEMGTGKSVQAVALLRLLDELGEGPFPALIVCPNSVKNSWVKEFAMFWPDAHVQIVHGSAATRRGQLEAPADVYILNWEGLRLHSRLAGYGSYALRSCRVCDQVKAETYANAAAALEVAEAKLTAPELDVPEDEEIDEARQAELDAIKAQLNEELEAAKARMKAADRETSQSSCEKCPRELNEIPWRTVIADEGHKAKDPRSKQTRALWASSRPAVRRIFMTGTPIANRPDDFWSLLHYMEPREWQTKTKYVDYFCRSQFNFWGGIEILGLDAEHRDQFFKIVDPRTRRMLKKIVLPQLPDKIFTTRWAEMSPKQTKAYNQLVEEKIAEIGGVEDHEDLDMAHLLVAANALTRDLRLLQFASAYMTIDNGHALMDEPSNKLDVLDEIIEELEGEQLVVFAMSKQLIDLACARADKAGIKYGRITGDETIDERQAATEAFQDGRLRIMYATTGAGGVGITLTAAKYLVRLQRDWSAVNNQQSVDRVHRIGSEIHDFIGIIDIVAPGTVEEHQIEVLEGKAENLEEIVRDRKALAKLLKGGS